LHLDGKRVVLTGAAGGMGNLIAAELNAHGARLVLTDMAAQPLLETVDRLGAEHTLVVADLCTSEGRGELVDACSDLGGIDLLINAAGMSDFAMVEQQSAARIELMIAINLTVPMLLCQALLPMLQTRDEAAIVNIGSTFGAIGHPGFAAYCASKSGLHRFTEALRRELADTQVEVFYIAPRAVQTKMNSAAVVELNREMGNTMDSPELAVSSLVRILSTRSAGDYYLGWPEKLFARLNGVLPGLVDGSLAKQLATIRRLARI
jgi:short-subunit dehydrogenase